MNKKIAELKGLCLHDNYDKDYDDPKSNWICQDCGKEFTINNYSKLFENDKDWQHNIADAWELMEEILSEGKEETSICGCVSKPRTDWIVEFSDGIEVSAKTAPEAICKAWIAWKKGE